MYTVQWDYRTRSGLLAVQSENGLREFANTSGDLHGRDYKKSTQIYTNLHTNLYTNCSQLVIALWRRGRRYGQECAVRDRRPDRGRVACSEQIALKSLGKLKVHFKSEPDRRHGLYRTVRPLSSGRSSESGTWCLSYSRFVVVVAKNGRTGNHRVVVAGNHWAGNH